jgi:hypothetical protein
MSVEALCPYASEHWTLKGFGSKEWQEERADLSPQTFNEGGSMRPVT